jgi:prevent-host-death family protein
MRPIVVGMHEAKTHFSRLVRDAAAGREVIVENGGRPVAKIVGYTPQSSPRKPGRLAGKIRIKRGFDQLPPGFEDAFGDE